MKSESKSRIVEFQNFTWIDICIDHHSNLDYIATQHQLDYYQVLDSLQVGHLPKFESLTNYQFLILRAFTADNVEKTTTINELSNKIAFFYNQSKIITIHRSKFSFLDQITSSFDSSEHLLLHILDLMLRTYQPPLNNLDDMISKIEENIFLRDTHDISLRELYFLKSQARLTKKLLIMTQNVMEHLNLNDNYSSGLQDLKDRLINYILNYEEIIENATNLMNTYLSVNAQKSNDVMKLLTIFSAFFLPLTFIAGIYGMNFHYMPELEFRFGYFICLLMMLIVVVVIYIWFKRKRIL